MALPAEDQTLGQYIIDEKIAQGGMAEIFRGRALDPGGLERPVVIKRILPQIAADAEFIEMLVQEAKLAVQLSHGNIAQVFDLGRLDNDYFMVMEYVDGESLSRIARHLRHIGEMIPVPIALYMIAEVANGLDYMHHKTDARGIPLHIVHRDISPQNIIVTWSGTVKIIDFGIAKASTHISTTDSGVVKGKFAYMSPEHVNGEKLDSRTDIFSLSVILWELLSNQRLFKGKNNRETIQRVKRCRVSSCSSFRKDIPKDVDRILKKGLSKNRKNRFASAHDLQLNLIRTLVRHYPNFAPKDLQDYLATLFAERIGEEPTVVSKGHSHEAPTLIDEVKEATVLADPIVIKKRLEELETYDLGVDEESEQEAPPDEPQEEVKEVRSYFRKIPWKKGLQALPSFKRLIRWAVLLSLALGLSFGIYWLTPRLKTFFKTDNKPKLTEPIQEPPKPVPPPPTPKPVVIHGRLNVLSTPRGAKIFLNDRDTGFRTPAILEEIETGLIYRIGLFLKPYEYWEGKAQVTAEKMTEIQAELRVNFGSLQITSHPAGATIFIDGENKGPAPLRLQGLKPGSVYEVRIERPGYTSWQQSTKIFAGKASVIRAVLKKENR